MTEIQEKEKRKQSKATLKYHLSRILEICSKILGFLVKRGTIRRNVTDFRKKEKL